MSNQNASIAYFGPAGSYTHQAAHERFGNEIRYIPQVTIADVFEAVEKGLTTYGIVPFENSTFGSVVTTLDKFINTETQIIEEICLTAFGQCQNWLDQHLKHAARVESSSTSHAAELSASEPGSAAISSIICSKLYGLKVLEKNIQDKNDNTTRFFILINPNITNNLTFNQNLNTIKKTITTKSSSNGCNNNNHCSNKTLISFTVDNKSSNALCDSLKIFKDLNIGLTKIDSRPSLQRLWHYVFFVELEGNKDDYKIQKALDNLCKYCMNLKVLGSYFDNRVFL
ncbi:7193_t:CDS:2 [Entrophospora sp. SA101]|nr:7193_t:CDS:2 [Entrophospora sp. SA101]